MRGSTRLNSHPVCLAAQGPSRWYPPQVDILHNLAQLLREKDGRQRISWASLHQLQGQAIPLIIQNVTSLGTTCSCIETRTHFKWKKNVCIRQLYLFHFVEKPNTNFELQQSSLHVDCKGAINIFESTCLCICLNKVTFVTPTRMIHDLGLQCRPIYVGSK